MKSVKLTAQRLRKIIKEELSKLRESRDDLDFNIRTNQTIQNFEDYDEDLPEEDRCTSHNTSNYETYSCQREIGHTGNHYHPESGAWVEEEDLDQYDDERDPMFNRY